MSVVYPSQVEPEDYTMYVKGSLITAVPSPELELNKYEGTNGSTVLQAVLDALYAKGGGLIEVKSKIELPLPVTWRANINVRGLGWGRSGFKASASMTKMFDLTALPAQSKVVFEDLDLDGNNLATQIIDASHATNTWIQLQPKGCWIHGASGSGSKLINGNNIDGIRASLCWLWGANLAGTELLSEYGLYIDECGGHTVLDNCILSSMKKSHLYYKNGPKLTVTKTNFSSVLAPSGPYMQFEDTQSEVVVTLDDVWIESPISGGMNDALIKGGSGSGTPPMMVDIKVPRFKIFTSATHGFLTGYFRTINIYGGYMLSSGAHPYLGNPNVLNSLFMVDTHINKNLDYTNITRYVVRTPTLAYVWLTNLVSLIPNTIMFVTSYTWENMPATETELYETKEDLSGVNQIRMVGRVKTAGATNAKLKIQYSTDESTWYESGLDIPLGTIGTKIDGWLTIPPAMKADVYLRLVGIDGDGVADPWFQTVCMQIR